MTVEELIKELSSFNPDTPVVMYEGSIDRYFVIEKAEYLLAAKFNNMEYKPINEDEDSERKIVVILK